MDDMRGALLVVATVTATITYQLVVDPPEGVWKRSMANESASISFYFCNTAGFTASMSVILLLISGISLKNKIFLGLLMLIMCTTLSCLVITYVMALSFLFPNNVRKKMQLFIIVPVLILFILDCFVIIIHTYNIMYSLYNLLCVLRFPARNWIRLR